MAVGQFLTAAAVATPDNWALVGFCCCPGKITSSRKIKKAMAASRIAPAPIAIYRRCRLRAGRVAGCDGWRMAGGGAATGTGWGRGCITGGWGGGMDTPG